MSSSEQESYAVNKARITELEQRRTRIRKLNDDLRRTLRGGLMTVTCGIKELGPLALLSILTDIQGSENFSSDNDPHAEHDFGAVIFEGQQIFWKIDYYDKRLEYGSPDPADPSVTTRVITIMLASEY